MSNEEFDARDHAKNDANPSTSKGTDWETEAHCLVLLLEDGFIDQDVYAVAARIIREIKEASQRSILLDQDLFGTPGEALQWLAAQGLVPREALGEIASRLLVECQDDEYGMFRLHAYSALDPLRFGERVTPIVAKRERRRRLRLFSGWTAGASLAAVAVAYCLSPSAPPACKSKEASASLFGIGMHAATSSIEALEAGFPSLSNIREVGYEKESRSRGCTVDVAIGNKRDTLGYVIRPAAEGKSAFEVKMTTSGFVHAYYGGSGESGSSGAPIGPTSIRKAFMKGLEILQTGDLANLQAAGKKDFAEARSSSTLRERVMSVNPVGNCSQRSASQFVCPLRIHYQDPLLSMIRGDGMIEITGNFTFEKGNWLNGWQPSSNFKTEFLAALASATASAATITK